MEEDVQPRYSDTLQDSYETFAGFCFGRKEERTSRYSGTCQWLGNNFWTAFGSY